MPCSCGPDFHGRAAAATPYRTSALTTTAANPTWIASSVASTAPVTDAQPLIPQA